MRFKLVVASLLLTGMFFVYGGVNNNATSPKVIGVDTFSGVVKNVETIENNVFLVVSGDKEDRIYYASKDRDVAKDVLKLNNGDTVEVKYVLGTPQKYKNTMAMPLSVVKVIK